MNGHVIGASPWENRRWPSGLNVAELLQLALLLVAVGRWRDFSPACSGSAAARFWYRCFTNAFGSPACRSSADAAVRRHLACHHHSTSIRSYRAHYARGAVDMEILRVWWLPVLIGVVAGSVTARYAPERLFKIVFVTVAWFAAARLLSGRETWKFGDDLPKGPLMRVFGFFVGLFAR